MRTRTKKAGSYMIERSHAPLSTGEMVSMLRELKGWTQEELAKASKIAATNISAIENDRLELGKARAIALANAFDVHPATLMFPDFPIKKVA